jgi:hypothetical protein
MEELVEKEVVGSGYPNCHHAVAICSYIRI